MSFYKTHTEIFEFNPQCPLTGGKKGGIILRNIQTGYVPERKVTVMRDTTRRIAMLLLGLVIMSGPPSGGFGL